jgi:hypothetical protein
MSARSIEKHTAETLRVRLAEILETWPLYREFNYEGESPHLASVSSYGVSRRYGLLPEVIRLYCDSRHCKNLQLWQLTADKEVYFPAAFENKTYRCRNCRERSVTYTIYWNDAEQSTSGTFFKIGQYPPLSYRPPKELARRLDKEDHSFYERALICRNFNYGLGAVAYMRRVVENRTNDLLDLIAAAMKAEGVTGERLAEIEEVKKSKVYDKKLEVAQKLLPARLIKEGENPIRKVHALTSEAIHEKPEQECIEIFDGSRVAFEYVLSELEGERARAEEYAKALKALKEKAGPKPEGEQQAPESKAP